MLRKLNLTVKSYFISSISKTPVVFFAVNLFMRVVAHILVSTRRQCGQALIARELTLRVLMVLLSVELILPLLLV